MAERIEIGYLCQRGPHYCFYADPEEGGACGSKSVAKVFVEFDVNQDDLYEDETFESFVNGANDDLRHVIETWRGA